MTQNSLKPELFSQVFHSPVLGLAIINQEKRIVDMNEKLADLLACKREDVLGKTTAAIGLNSKKDLHNKEDIFSLAIKEGSIEKYELEITTSQRKDLTLEFSAAILENEGDTCWLVTATDKAPHELLSNREFEILKLLAVGKTISGISEALSLALTTVSTYRSRIMDKLGFTSNAELTRYAISHNIITDIDQ